MCCGRISLCEDDCLGLARLRDTKTTVVREDLAKKETHRDVYLTPGLVAGLGWHKNIQHAAEVTAIAQPSSVLPKAPWPSHRRRLGRPTLGPAWPIAGTEGPIWVTPDSLFNLSGA
jgi:hypothetical protein